MCTCSRPVLVLVGAYGFDSILDAASNVHHGLDEQTPHHTARRDVLDAAFAALPERFVRRPPPAARATAGAWINKPVDTEEVAD